MSLRRSLIVAKHEFRVLRRDPMPLTVLLVMPVLMASLYQTTFKAALLFGGHPHASGSDYAVPAMIAQFGFFLAPFTGFVFFREHIFKTWVRVRASAASMTEIVVGKALPMVVMGVLQIVVLLIYGVVALDLHLRGKVFPVAVVAFAYVCCAVAVGLALTAVVRTSQQMNAFGFLGATVFGAIGGALVPLSTLPRWTHHLSPATPQYWVMRASNAVILDGQSVGAIALPLVVLAAFALGCTLIAVRFLRFDDRTVGWS